MALFASSRAGAVMRRRRLAQRAGGVLLDAGLVLASAFALVWLLR